MARATTELAHLFRQLKAPAAARALPKLANRARAEDSSYEQFAAALSKTETDSRDSHGGQAPARRTSRSPWGSAPASPGSASRSRPRPSGSPCWPTPNAQAASTVVREDGLHTVDLATGVDRLIAPDAVNGQYAG